MSRLQRLPGCVCHFKRSFQSSVVSQDVPQASTSRAGAENLQTTRPYDPYNAFVSVAEDSGSATAQDAGDLSPLTFSVKDNFVTSDEQASATSCGSRMLQDYRSPFEATVVKKLRKHGARILGKTNMDEFGMGSNGLYSMHGPVKNPLDTNRVAGGSSSGAAASVAAGYCDVALGSDTGGSVRLPASYTGTLGFKPSYGLLSRYGLVAYASSLDTVGIISRKSEYARRTFWALNEHDDNDPTSTPSEHRPERPSTSEIRPDRLRVGIPIECFPAELTQASIRPLRRALNILRERVEVEVVSVSLPSTSKALSAYYTIASAESSSNLARYDGIRYGFRSEGHIEETRTAGFGEEVQKRIILGTYALTADAFDNYFLAAQSLREDLKHEMDHLFRKRNPLRYSSAGEGNASNLTSAAGVDVLLYPSAISAAPTLKEAHTSSSSVAAYVQDVLTVPASMAGLPAASCPVQLPDSDHLPVGVQVVGQWGDDELVLQVAELLEI